MSTPIRSLSSGQNFWKETDWDIFNSDIVENTSNGLLLKQPGKYLIISAYRASDISGTYNWGFGWTLKNSWEENCYTWDVVTARPAQPQFGVYETQGNQYLNPTMYLQGGAGSLIGIRACVFFIV